MPPALPALFLAIAGRRAARRRPWPTTGRPISKRLSRVVVVTVQAVEVLCEDRDGQKGLLLQSEQSVNIPIASGSFPSGQAIARVNT
jgi:hypothetical protein